MITRMILRTIAFGMMILAGSTLARAQEWTRFRGSDGSGISAEKNIPAKFAEQDFLWKIALPGVGHSSPVVWGNLLFIASADEKSGQQTLSCIKTGDGKEAWQADLESAASHHHDFNSHGGSSCSSHHS